MRADGLRLVAVVCKRCGVCRAWLVQGKEKGRVFGCGAERCGSGGWWGDGGSSQGSWCSHLVTCAGCGGGLCAWWVSCAPPRHQRCAGLE